jgi:predicted nuclease with TOPRIM domain
MNERAERLRADIARLEQELTRLKAELRSLEGRCDHAWEALPSREHIVASHTWPAQGCHPPHYVPEQRTTYYRRQCRTCGRLEVTTKLRTETRVSHKPAW